MAARGWTSDDQSGAKLLAGAWRGLKVLGAGRGKKKGQINSGLHGRPSTKCLLMHVTGAPPWQCGDLSVRSRLADLDSGSGSTPGWSAGIFHSEVMTAARRQGERRACVGDTDGKTGSRFTAANKDFPRFLAVSWVCQKWTAYFTVLTFC